jgi:hypothetical protein
MIDPILAGFLSAVAIAGFFGGVFVLGLVGFLAYEELKRKGDK